MKIHFSLFLGSLVMVSASHGVAVDFTGNPEGSFSLSQNTAPADRTMGNSSMGLGSGIQRLPEQEEGTPDLEDHPPRQRYDEAEHGGHDTDMEHRPRRTLGDDRKD